MRRWAPARRVREAAAAMDGRGFTALLFTVLVGALAVGAALAGDGRAVPAVSAGQPGARPADTAARASGATAYVRLNQVGYPAAAAKRAYLLSDSAANGATFTIVDGGATVFTGTVGGLLGSWSSRFPYVYALDFSALADPGTYTLVVNGPVTARSPAFSIGSGSDVYGPLLDHALRFYQVQRDGPRFIRSKLRTAAGHLHDRRAMTYATPRVNGDGIFKGDLRSLHKRIDASGGWWDAGDYLKFVHAASYTEAMLLCGVRDYPAQMGPASAGSDFSAETRFGAHWLLKMWDDSTRTFYYQVGIGSGNARTAGDHDVWRLPQADDRFGAGDPLYRYIRHRPVFRAGPGGSPISPNLAGRDSAALALAYQVNKADRPLFAGRCLTAAVHIFDLADPDPGRLMTAIPYDYYPETEWRDDMELGATELYFALAGGAAPAGLPHDAGYYLQQAAHWAGAYIAGPNDAADTLNLYDVSGLAHYELYRAIAQAGDPAGLEVTRAALLDDLKKQLDKAVAQAATDPFQFGFTWAQWDTTSHGAGLSVMASEYDELSGGSEYAVWSSRWLANILGANAWGTSLIVGAGTTFPHCLQHQVANLEGTLNGRPPVLLGACVEGPNAYPPEKGGMPGMRRPRDRKDHFAVFNGQGAEWQDRPETYANTEPAIDLTAASPLAFARQIAGQY